MNDYVLILDNPDDWSGDELAAAFGDHPAPRRIAAREYLTGAEWERPGTLRVINLCRDRNYLDIGYYCSLLAEARGHRVLPGVRAINDLAANVGYPVDRDLLNRKVQRIMNRRRSGLVSTRLELVLCFGEPPLAELSELSRTLYNAYPAPVLKVVLEKGELWDVSEVSIVSPVDLEDADRARFAAALRHHLGKRWHSPRMKRVPRHYMAILHNPDEALPPSNRKALAHFIRAAKDLRISAELITAADYPRLAEFDALFIRETTSVLDHTYRFARKAQREGLVVIDDPDSILRCTNKIYLAERLDALGIATPRTVVVQREAVASLGAELGFPMVLKVPDGSFSRGVIKVGDEAELAQGVDKLFKDTELVLAQAFVPTTFDWRIGLINGEPIFACQYGMAKGHWQIVDHGSGSKPVAGDHRTLALKDTPAEVLELAVQAGAVMGNGLYGVDIKQTDNGLMVIEVNDNPNLDAGVEDQVLGMGLYARIMGEFARRLEAVGGDLRASREY